jgi:hypothetical protein
LGSPLAALSIRRQNIPHKFFVENSIGNKDFFRMVILIEDSSDYRVTIDTNSVLLKKVIDVGVRLALSSFPKENQNISSCIEIILQMLEFNCIEHFSRISKHKKVVLL